MQLPKKLLVFLQIIVLISVSLLFLKKPIFASSDFVTASGRSLFINGTSFKSIGVNRYNLMTTAGTPFVGCGGTFKDSDLVSLFSEFHSMGVTSVRFWLFQEFTKSGSDLSRFDNLLSLGKQYNVKLIPVFENQWKDCTQGGSKTSAWYQMGYRTPYGNYPISLKDYIGKIVPKYANNPEILMWQIMNEAQSSDSTALYNFAKDVSGYIKSLDLNHLVSFGTMGSGQPGSSVYKQIHALTSIDVLEYHDYHAETTALPSTLSDRIKDSISLNKPLIIGESGISLSNGYTPSERADYFNKKIAVYFDNGGSLYTIWSYHDVNGQDTGYTFNFTDPLGVVIKNYSSSFANAKLVISPTATATPNPTPTPTITSMTKLGGLNLNGYCVSIGLGSSASVQNGVWICTKNGPLIPMTDACKWQYNNASAVAVNKNATNPYSWSCYGSKIIFLQERRLTFNI